MAVPGSIVLPATLSAGARGERGAPPGDAGHGIQLDRPAVVITAIEEVLAMARGG